MVKWEHYRSKSAPLVCQHLGVVSTARCKIFKVSKTNLIAAKVLSQPPNISWQILAPDERCAVDRREYLRQDSLTIEAIYF